VGDGSRRALAIGGRPPPGGERGLEPADLPLEPADALERQHHRADGLCFELPALGSTITSSAGISPRRNLSPTARSTSTAIGLPTSVRRRAIWPTSIRRPIWTSCAAVSRGTLPISFR